MSIEIEKKYRLTREQFMQVEKDLEELGAEYAGEDFEENILFGSEYLKHKNAVVRIRKTDRQNTLTYKQFVVAGPGGKQHIEHESIIDSPGEIAKVVEHLGLERRMVYEKRRKIWKFRDVEVVLDELPFGLYMEIEGALMAIAEAEMILEADDFEAEPKTYPFLTKEMGKKIENRIEARFDSNPTGLRNG
ncbi:MAG: class IV adenylate cyclase [Pyrinomonadaceae bacterium]|nr:class IV adenylate cyclase [Pyrinomonadaceae bacterium]